MTTHARSNEHKPKGGKGKAGKSVAPFLEAFVLTMMAGLTIVAAARYGWLDAWQWAASRGPSIYVASGVLVALVALAVTARKGKPAFWGAILAVLGALALALW